MGQGKERRNEVTTRKEEVGQTNTIYERGKKLLEHLHRMPSETAAKQLLYYQPTGRRNPGRARRRWLDEDETG
jgi:hypothetical protein